MLLGLRFVAFWVQVRRFGTLQAFIIRIGFGVQCLILVRLLGALRNGIGIYPGFYLGVVSFVPDVVFRLTHVVAGSGALWDREFVCGCCSGFCI